MGVGEQVRLRVEAAQDEDDGELARLALLLRKELLDLDVTAVEPVPAEITRMAKGLAAVAGTLLVWLGPAGLGAVLRKVADWAARSGRVVEITVDGKSLKLGRASQEQQDRLVEAFLAQLDRGP